ncbi:MAG: hypothetical protein LBV41_04895 [Cytophagaceae bacterium]|jgi:hypothetical protein|nr:hypothetical protein [Cytophagaceae bacterium]
MNVRRNADLLIRFMGISYNLEKQIFKSAYFLSKTKTSDDGSTATAYIGRPSTVPKKCGVKLHRHLKQNAGRTENSNKRARPAKPLRAG